MPKIIYTEHAKERMLLRKIKEEDVENAIINFDHVIEENDIKIFQKKTDDKILRVICRVSGNFYIVITAYFTKKKKYRSEQ